jgi:carboxypeptidase Taq
MTKAAYAELLRRARETAVLGSCAGVLGWDERTQLPPAGVSLRGEQMALLARLMHERQTAPAYGELFHQIDPTTLDDAGQANVRELRRTHERASKLPSRLVEELARVTTEGQQAWQMARAANDFAGFRPSLERIVALKREEAQAVGYPAHPYDALLDEYEPGTTTAELTALFADLAQQLVPLVQQLTNDPRLTQHAHLLERDYPVDRQALFGQAAAAAVGFRFDAGRLDVTTHPFCSGIGPGDVRITTRYHARRFGDAFFGILHEAGHGIYEQNLPADHFGTPLGMACSLGIHESQSRLWENQVGRSVAFWEHFFPRAQQTFPTTLGDVAANDFYWAINNVRKSFIRVDADEVTYNLHIILRFELEQALLTGAVRVAEVPGVWDERFEKLFGLRPPTTAQGCLQDIHWSGGGIGYFPTYTLGNLYAAQFIAQAQSAGAADPALFARGQFTPLRTWLNQHLHQHGQRYRAGELCQRITGQPLQVGPFIAYLRQKFAAFLT